MIAHLDAVNQLNFQEASPSTKAGLDAVILNSWTSKPRLLGAFNLRKLDADTGQVAYDVMVNISDGGCRRNVGVSECKLDDTHSTWSWTNVGLLTSLANKAALRH
jgi:hypothetical protein